MDKQNCKEDSNISTRRCLEASSRFTSRQLDKKPQLQSATLLKEVCNSKPRKYTDIHTDRKPKQIKNAPFDSSVKKMRLADQIRTKCAIKIQRFWRFQLLMRRKIQTAYLDSLLLENEILERSLKNQQIRARLITEAQERTKKKANRIVEKHLKPAEEYLKGFIKKSLLTNIMQDKKLNKAVEACQRARTEVAQQADELEELRTELEQQLQQRQNNKQKEEGLLFRLAQLHKKALVENRDRKAQAEADGVSI